MGKQIAKAKAFPPGTIVGTGHAESFLVDAGTVFAGLAKMNGGRVAIKIDRETQQIVGNPAGFERST